MWSQFYSLDGLEPYNLLYRHLILLAGQHGKTVDKRMVFDPRTPNDFPFDLVLGEQWRQSPRHDRDISDDRLHSGCYKPLQTSATPPQLFHS
jgi:hypothetical protein